MQTSDILRRVRQIEIQAKGLSHDLFAGRYHSAFRGRGMAFREVREYFVGDDVRDIDWNVTARMGKPYVKVYEEERELTVVLAIDMSAGLDFGTRGETKRDLVAMIAATLAFSAIANNDKVGVLLFTEQVEKFIPPASGKKHILHIIRELLTFRPMGQGTRIDAALAYLGRVVRKRATAFLISDFQTGGRSDSYLDSLKLAALRHNLWGIVVSDPAERELPAMGLVQFQDPETGATRWIDTSRKRVRRAYAEGYRAARQERRNALSRYGIDYAEVSTGEDFVPALIKMFAQR